MIDHHFKPWLIEVNQSPSFATDSPLDYEVKKSVLRDTFSLLNVDLDRRYNLELEKKN
jgi:tubulin polyglutamylase TTLL6/13